MPIDAQGQPVPDPTATGTVAKDTTSDLDPGTVELTARPECSDGIDNDRRRARRPGRRGLRRAIRTQPSSDRPRLRAAKLRVNAGPAAAAKRPGASVVEADLRSVDRDDQDAGPHKPVRLPVLRLRAGLAAVLRGPPRARAGVLQRRALAAADVAVRAPRLRRLRADDHRSLVRRGMAIERAQGPRRTSVLFFAAGLLANLVIAGVWRSAVPGPSRSLTAVLRGDGAVRGVRAGCTAASRCSSGRRP